MKTLKTLGAISVLAAAFGASSAYADAPRYDFVDLGYTSISDPSGSGLSSDHAYGVDGSFGFTDNLIGLASYAHESADFSLFGISGTASGNSYEAGLGWRFPLTSNMDIIPSLSYAHSSASARASFGPSASTSDSGYDAAVTLRAMVTDKLELDAGVDHSSPVASSNTVGVSGFYNFTSVFALGLGYADSRSDGQDTNAWMLTARFYFK
ncbi:MAG: outer membrane beta-barrel protein [Bacillota bacterium]